MTATLKMMRLHSWEEFQTWLARDPDVREELEEMIGAQLGLDTLSLDTLETFLLRRFRTVEKAMELDQRAVLDAAGRHVGMVMLFNVDGTKWDIDLDHEDSVYYRLPIIRLADGGQECPLSMVTACLDRRTGRYLRGLVETYEEEYNGATDV